MNLEQIKGKRTVARTLLTKLITKIEGVIDTPITASFLKEHKIEELHNLMSQLAEKIVDLKALDNEIEIQTDIKDMEKEIVASDKYRESSITCKTKLTRCIASLEGSDNLSPPRTNNENVASVLETSRSVRNENQIVKLPRLNIPTFHGDCSEWLDFWNCFEAAIHKNESLSNVEKFTYLKSYLRGTALSAVSGFALTNENYLSSITILTERFARLDLIASSHLNKIMSLESVKIASNVSALRKMYDKLLVEIRSLDNMKISVDSNLICTVIMQKIPEEINLQFNRQRKANELFDVQNLIEFLRKEIECREATFLLGSKNRGENETSLHKQQTSPKSKQYSNFKRNTTSFLLTNAENKNCIFCSKNHLNHQCPLNINDRKAALKTQGRCFLCLKRRHLMKNCWKKDETCKKCNKSHNSLICDTNHLTNNSEIDILPNDLKSQEINSLLCNDAQNNSQSVYLQTFSAFSRTRRGNQIVLRILNDSGANRSFIERETAELLGLKPISKESLSISTFGSNAPKRQLYNVVELKLWSLINPDRYIKIKAIVVDSITIGQIKVPSAYVKNIASKKGIQLADLGQSTEIQVLVGSDHIWEILGRKNIKLSKRIIASETPFGHILQGIEDRFQTDQTILNHLTVVKDDFDYERVKDLWELESLGIIADKEISQSNTDILKTFEENTTYINGRYETRLLWKDDHEGLSSNYEVSKRRLFRLNNTFKRDGKLYLRYKDIISDQLNDGIIEPVKICSNLDKQTGYFMPHHAVVRECKETTKVRICYDASSNAKGELSLNDCLDSGPNLNPDLLKIILKFRSYSIAFCADIQRAFLEVGIVDEDRKFLQFLWGEEGEADLELSDPKVRIYRFSRVPFGVKCSPFLLAATLRLHAAKYKTEFPEAFKMIEDLYVDDLICGQNSVAKAAQLSSECKNILKDASMNLRQWATNSKPLEKIWKENGFEVRTPTEESHIDLTVLGLIWNNEKDNFRITSLDLQKLQCSVVTKRMVLKACGMLFDPLGLFAPFSIRIKLLVQSLWKKGILWDDPIPPDDYLLYREWLREAPDISDISIPRPYFSNFNFEEIEVHLFSDASIKAYGAVAYFRVKYPNEKIVTSFVIAKARLAPLKEISLPRLELMGTLVSARLSQYLQDTFPWLSGDKVYLWTDSQVCLHWIRGQAADWKQFVKNRVSEIQAKTNPLNWKFCNGKSNPADKLTRGVKVNSLACDEVWWSGPPWLSDGGLLYDDANISKVTVPASVESERKRSCISLLTYTKHAEHLLNLDKYSKLSKVLRITAWIRRFINNSKPSATKFTGPLSAQELFDAELFWVKYVQRTEFSEELALLSQNKPLVNSSKLFNLNPKIDEKGLIRLGARLELAHLTDYQKFPFILPGKHRFTELLINREHQNLLHSGVSNTLVQIRDYYWIIKGRQAIKSVLYSCPTCKKLRATKGTQVTAPLPLDRMHEGSAFEITAVDFAGPLFVSDKNEKVYIALFTCSVTRAVHLELVTDLSAEKYLLAFRRFISRKGLCRVIYSDNAKTFKRAQTEIEHLWKMMTDPTVLNFYGSKGIKFKYIVERAAWWGGFWERMVKMTKIALRKVLGKALLSLEELQTVVVEIEAVINSRPLTYIFDSPSEPSPLTPSHFLVGKRLTSIPHHAGPSTVLSTTRNDTLKRYIYRQKLLDVLWKRWRKEYLLLLRNANCVTPINVKHTFQKDDVVLVSEDKMPRHMWKIARVIEVHPGRDGKVRSCTLKTANSVIKRPVQLLYHFEI